MVDFGIFRLTSLFMECLCIAPLTSAMMVMRGFVFHSLFCMMLISGSYLVCLCVRAWLGNLSWHSMNCTMSVRRGDIGVCVWFEALIMHKMHGLNLAWPWHIVCGHVHLRS